eukprot:CAMPEP_0196807938 /NCGR_PEP_ID=MMETSP1362-20130617/7917_1 /TAXON_ID=163516 /ORGANISM="Leptocylindrus danicus, Strain CCMP1856" /LENGTH=279 /DNA_ID=CAMNT_0042182057 /DNA_START=175 /DNA_END=1011 /DNA_ORIENTATION=-
MAYDTITTTNELTDTNLQRAKFVQGQKVYVKDTGGIYEATILEVCERSKLEHMCHLNRGASTLKSKQQYLDSVRSFLEESCGYQMSSWAYFIHFNGWKTRWDKWVWESVLLHDEAETREAVEKFQENVRCERNRKKEMKKNKATGRSNDESKRKRGRPKKEEEVVVAVHNKSENDSSCKQRRTLTNTEQNHHNESKEKCINEVFFEFPKTLREILVYDRGQINGTAGTARRVLNVPSACPISDMLIAFRKEVDKRIEERFRDVNDADIFARMEELKQNW